MQIPKTNNPMPVLDGLDAIQQQFSRLRLMLDAYTDQALEYVAEGESQRSGPVEQLRRELASELHQQRIALESQRLRLEAERAELRNSRAEVIRSRQERLGRLKSLLQDEALAMRRQAEALETQRKYAREVLAQRDSVMELQRLLADAEQRMIRRWGIQQAFGWSIRAMICLGLLLGLSYFAGAQLSRQTWMASAVVRHLGSEVPATPQWIEDQQKRLLDSGTLSRASLQLRQSGYLGPAQPQDIAQVLRGGLHVHAPGPNLLHVELHGADRELLAPVLNALVRAYAVPSSGAELTERGEFIPRMHIVQEAKAAPAPVFDNRSSLTAMLFAGSLGVTLLVLILFACLAIWSRRGEAASLQPGRVADDDVWKAYHDALEKPTSAEANPLF